MRRVTVHYRPSCAFSAATVAFLMLRGADVRLCNLDLHPDEEERVARAVKEELGQELETPTLEVEGEPAGRWHVAPPLSELKGLLSRWGLPAEVAPHEQLRAP